MPWNVLSRACEYQPFPISPQQLLLTNTLLLHIEVVDREKIALPILLHPYKPGKSCYHKREVRLPVNVHWQTVENPMSPLRNADLSGHVHVMVCEVLFFLLFSFKPQEAKTWLGGLIWPPNYFFLLTPRPLQFWQWHTKWGLGE